MSSSTLLNAHPWHVDVNTSAESMGDDKGNDDDALEPRVQPPPRDRDSRPLL